MGEAWVAPRRLRCRVEDEAAVQETPLLRDNLGVEQG